MQQYTVLEMGWGNYYAIPNENVSKFLALFENMRSVDSMYIGDKMVWYIKDNPRKLTMSLVDTFIPESQSKARYDIAQQEKANGA